MNNIIKCYYCKKVFIDIGTKICPFCKMDINNLNNDIFKTMFGQNNDPK